MAIWFFLFGKNRMIIELDDQFHGINFEEDADSRDALDSICISVSRGQHFISCSRGLIMQLEGERALSITSRGVLSDVRKAYSYTSQMLKDMRFRILVSPVGGGIEKLSAHRWLIPASHIARNGIQSTVLLTENSNDADIYIHAAKHYKLSTGFSESEINIRPRNGNGAGISQELDRINRAASEFCLCITDSDRISPNSTLGEIATACKRIEAGSQWVVKHDASISREIENLLPEKLVHGALEATNEECVEAWKMVWKLGQDTVNHADLKNGTTLRWIHQIPKGNPSRNFWLEKRDAVAGKTGKDDFCDEGTKCKAEECKCIVTPPVAKNMAMRVFNYMNSESVHEIYRRAKGSSNFLEWLRIGREVFEAGAAPKITRM